MNKYEEALEKIRLLDCYDEENFEIKFENIPILQELVDRATPKKANEIDFVCPNCNHSFCNYEGLYDGTLIGDFCQFCGQAIDWSDDK